jgi:hypothetical protein
MHKITIVRRGLSTFYTICISLFFLAVLIALYGQVLLSLIPISILVLLIIYQMDRKMIKSTFMNKVAKPIIIKQIPKYDLEPNRQPLSSYLRNEVYFRAEQRCENPFCMSKANLEIHHIDMNANNNKLFNLVALCKACHEDAHAGKFPPKQVHNWMSMDYKRLMRLRPSFNSGVFEDTKRYH